MGLLGLLCLVEAEFLVENGERRFGGKLVDLAGVDYFGVDDVEGFEEVAFCVVENYFIDFDVVCG